MITARALVFPVCPQATTLNVRSGVLVYSVRWQEKVLKLRNRMAVLLKALSDESPRWSRCH